MKYLLPLILIMACMASCATKKQILYFQDIEERDQALLETRFEPIIENNDILHVNVSSLDKDVVAPFQRSSGLPGTLNSNAINLQGYLVNADGNIQFPVLGDINAAGKTRNELEQVLRSRLTEYVTDVVVDIRIINFKVTVIGEVNNPGVYTIEDERVTLPQAIGLAGDLTEDAKRLDITVIREVDGQQQIYKIDFTASDFFSSPAYFLKQNDVVYVQPSSKGVKKSGFLPDIPSLLSLFTVILSTVILITNN